jgi:hypothetical protein
MSRSVGQLVRPTNMHNMTQQGTYLHVTLHVWTGLYMVQQNSYVRPPNILYIRIRLPSLSLPALPPSLHTLTLVNSSTHTQLISQCFNVARPVYPLFSMFTIESLKFSKHSVTNFLEALPNTSVPLCLLPSFED